MSYSRLPLRHKEGSASVTPTMPQIYNIIVQYKIVCFSMGKERTWTNDLKCNHICYRNRDLLLPEDMPKSPKSVILYLDGKKHPWVRIHRQTNPCELIPASNKYIYLKLLNNNLKSQSQRNASVNGISFIKSALET